MGKNGLQVVEINSPCKSLEVIKTSWGQTNLGKKKIFLYSPKKP